MGALDRLHIFYDSKFHRSSDYLWNSRYPRPKFCRNSTT